MCARNLASFACGVRAGERVPRAVAEGMRRNVEGGCKREVVRSRCWSRSLCESRGEKTARSATHPNSRASSEYARLRRRRQPWTWCSGDPSSSPLQGRFTSPRAMQSARSKRNDCGALDPVRRGSIGTIRGRRAGPLPFHRRPRSASDAKPRASLRPWPSDPPLRIGAPTFAALAAVRNAAVGACAQAHAPSSTRMNARCRCRVATWRISALAQRTTIGASIPISRHAPPRPPHAPTPA